MDLIQACQDRNLFAPWFRDESTWRSWFAFIRALFGLLMSEAELELFTRCTGRARPPTDSTSEAWLICGRRSGKSFILSLIAVYVATFKDWRDYLAPGERATVMVIAADRKQARVIMRYVGALLTEVPLLKPLIERSRDRADDMAYDLQGRVTIEVHTTSFRTVRGYSVCAALLDEIGFWRAEDSASPDVEVIEAIRPAMATIPGSVLLAASSPYSRRGALWEAHRRHFAKDGPVLVWQSDTRTMNPTVPPSVIERALERDPAVAASEWLATFRSDLESFVDRAAVEACIEPGILERPRARDTHYVGFVDPSGGRQDSMVSAVAHREGDALVLDCLRERRPPLDPAETTREQAQMFRSYGIGTIESDRWGGEWPVAEFRKHGVNCQQSARPKSDLYRELLPLINSRRAVLLDHPRLVAQLVSLERRIGRGGRDNIDHPPGAHDDRANAAAGALVLAATRQKLPLVW